MTYAANCDIFNVKKIRAFYYVLATITIIVFTSGIVLVNEKSDIIHDGEYYFLKAEHGEKWAREDKQIDEKLAIIRNKNGGKRPNILYVLIDDVSLGQVGRLLKHSCHGIQRINMTYDVLG